jgi:hypothetical protein
MVHAARTWPEAWHGVLHDSKQDSSNDATRECSNGLGYEIHFTDPIGNA